MNRIYLTDVVIRCISDKHDDLPDDARLFMFVNGAEFKRTNYLVVSTPAVL